jgi:hypothetical protein
MYTAWPRRVNQFPAICGPEAQERRLLGSGRRALPGGGRDYDVPVTGSDSEAAPATGQAQGVSGEAEPDAGGRAFLESLMDTELYSMGAFFCDEHPDLVEEVTERSVAIERQGLEAYARASETSVEETFGTLLTGLAVRYYKAVAG